GGTGRLMLLGNVKDVDRLILLGDAFGLVLLLAPIRHRHNPCPRDPGDSLDVAVSQRAIVGSWKRVELSFVAPGPAGLVEPAHPEHRVLLRDDRNAAVIEGHARIIHEGKT